MGKVANGHLKARNIGEPPYGWFPFGLAANQWFLPAFEATLSILAQQETNRATILPVPPMLTRT